MDINLCFLLVFINFVLSGLTGATIAWALNAMTRNKTLEHKRQAFRVTIKAIAGMTFVLLGLCVGLRNEIIAFAALIPTALFMIGGFALNFDRRMMV